MNNGVALRAPLASAKAPHKTAVALAVAVVIFIAVAVAIYQPYCPTPLVCLDGFESLKTITCVKVFIGTVRYSSIPITVP
jgi:hypothetical protein